VRLFGEKNFEVFDDVDDAPASSETPQARVADGESFTLEFVAEAADGTRRRFGAVARPIGRGDERGGVIVIHDIEQV
jgi:hypothetical protein